jgi:pyruvate formate lyase activating enzyme
MAICKICKNASSEISNALDLCLECIRRDPEEARKIAIEIHTGIREQWGLPGEPPKNPKGILCDLCVNQCQIGDGEWGYCGLRQNVRGKIKGVSISRGKLSWYHDPLPTNCVGDWVCPAGADCGYTAYSYKEGPEYGYQNLAVFPHACTFHCLYCQNWHFRYRTFDDEYKSVENLVQSVNTTTSCVCYFGGDPSPQLPYLLKASQMMRDNNKGRILRICWETNGAMSKAMLKDLADTALVSGGCIKFDLKAWDEALHIALTGVTNKQTIDNFRWLSELISLRPDPPFLIAGTTLVSGYIDGQEVGKIARFIASLNPNIPYSLLAFHPEYKMTDLPCTSRKQAQECLQAAQDAGLKRVHIGNRHLLW